MNWLNTKCLAVYEKWLNFITWLKVSDKRAFVMLMCSLVCGVGISILSPYAFGSILFKLCLVFLGFCLGFLCDRLLFPKSKISNMFDEEGNIIDKQFYIACMFRRAMICGITVLGIALAL